MKTRSFPMGILSGIGMLILILDSQTAISGAQESIPLVLHTVIPSLFPFFFLSIWLTSSSDGSIPLLKPFARIFRLPDNMSFLLLPAFLGGYPSGAQAVTSAWEQGQLSKKDAEHLLGFCSNAGPSFLFGIIAQMFPKKWMAWALWIFHILGAFIASQILPAAACENIPPIAVKRKTLPDVLKAAILVTAQICGWVILFRILLAFLNRWILWIFPEPLFVLFTGVLELTNGCCILNQITDIRLRFVICSALLSLGGCCVTLQTLSVTKSLSLRYYYIGKAIQTIASVCFSIALMYRYPLMIVTLLPILLYILLKIQKRSSILVPSGV